MSSGWYASLEVVVTKSQTMKAIIVPPKAGLLIAWTVALLFVSFMLPRAGSFV